MRRWRILGGCLTALMAATPAVPATAVPRAVPRAAPAAAPAASAPVVPCPKAQPLTRIPRPPRPVPPRATAEQKQVGGAALATPGLVVPAGAPRPPALTAAYWLVADLDSGAVLGACGPHEASPPASTQKLLLTATVLPKLNRRQVVTVTRKDMNFEPGSSAVGLVTSGRYTVETLFLGLLLNSGNDAANVLSRLGGGPSGVPGTVRAMNAEAQRLGAYQTHAVIPAGLDAAGQFTSPYDLALIARECFGYPDFRRYTLTKTAQMPKQAHAHGFQIQNENKLIFKYPGGLGGKTGFTPLSRHTYVGAAQRNGRRLVATLLSAEPTPLRGWQQGGALLDWGFRLPAGAQVGHLVTPQEVAETAAKAQAATVTPAATARRAGAGLGAAPLALVTAAALAVIMSAVIVFSARRRRLRRGPMSWLTPRGWRPLHSGRVATRSLDDP